MKSENPRTAMNLRNVTIWTTGVMMIVPLFVPSAGLLVYANGDVFAFVFSFCLLYWVANGSPLFVSLIIAIKLKYSIPLSVLLLSTIVYAYLYLFMCIHVLWGMKNPLGILVFGFGVSPLILLPAWILALVLDWHYTKKLLSESGNSVEQTEPGAVPPQ